MDELSTHRFAAVADRRPDDTFLFGVVTTGVFCRPGCASRTPRPENVRFFDDVSSAEAAGFRPCRRCRPERRDEDPGRGAVVALCRRLETEERVSVAEVARTVGYSERHLRRLFLEVTGVSPGAYARACRAARSRARLAGSTAVASAAYDAGFGSSRAFYEHGPQLGMSPATYRRGAPGEVVRYSVVESELGALLAAATDRGLCAVRLGDVAAALERELREEFSAAQIVRDDDALAPMTGALVNLAAGEGRDEQLPLDVRGTVFQVRVWEALRSIERGTTVSYAEVAERIGSPRAVRAVGSACAKNPVALTVPCHRVVRSDGGLGGYRWGLARKEALLEAEAGDPTRSR